MCIQDNATIVKGNTTVQHRLLNTQAAQKLSNIFTNYNKFTTFDIYRNILKTP
jgi:hypothetical protein